MSTSENTSQPLAWPMNRLESGIFIVLMLIVIIVVGWVIMTNDGKPPVPMPTAGEVNATFTATDETHDLGGDVILQKFEAKNEFIWVVVHEKVPAGTTRKILVVNARSNGAAMNSPYILRKQD